MTFALYQITDNGLAFISKHVSSTMAMIQSTIIAECGDWEYFKTPVHETWVSDAFCIMSEAGE